jgi:hypothetical protein
MDLSKEEVVRQIRNFMPDIDFDPELNSASAESAYTTLRPNSPTDTIVLDYNIVRLLRDKNSKDTSKIAALFFYGDPPGT